MGKLFWAFENALSCAWIKDTQYGYAEGHKGPDAAWAKEKEARVAFMDKLMQIAGV